MSVPAAPLSLRSRLKVRQLVVLVAVAEAGSLRGAAAALRVSQPALSKTVRELEAMFERPLFSRDSRGLRQTAHGAAAIEHARRLLRDVDSIGATLEAVDGGASGRIRIGVIPTISSEWLQKAIERLLYADRPLAAQIVEGTTDVLVESLRQKRLDCVVGRVTPAMAADDVEARTIFRQTLRVVVRAGHPLLRGRRKLALAHLAGCEWILTPPGTPTRQLIDTVFFSAGLPPPRAGLETYSLQIMRSFVSTGNTLGAVPHDVAQEWARLSGLRILPFGWEMSPVSLMWLKRDATSPMIRRFGEAAALAP